MGKKYQKKIALINDISGYGRCSLTVQIPIISALGVQTCPVPTGIFSNHTGYESYVKHDLTSFLDDYLDQWIRLGLKFDGICIGYLTSPSQVQIAERMIKELKKDEGIVILDPVMGDDGHLYSGYTQETATAVSELIKYADIITPNTTELSFLTGSEYDSKKDILHWIGVCGELSERTSGSIILTGVTDGDYISNICIGASADKDNDEKITDVVKVPMVGNHRPGTGDVFSAIIAADALNKISLKTSVEKASDFICKCLKRSDELDIPLSDGLCFEEFLRLL